MTVPNRVFYAVRADDVAGGRVTRGNARERASRVDDVDGVAKAMGF